MSDKISDNMDTILLPNGNPAEWSRRYRRRIIREHREKEEQERNMRNATLMEDIRYFNQIESRRDAIYALLWLTEKNFSISDIIEACDYPYLAINNQILSTTERQNVKSLGIETQNKSNIVREHYVEFTTGRASFTDI